MGSLMSTSGQSVRSPSSDWPPIFTSVAGSQYFQYLCLYFPDKLPEPEGRKGARKEMLKDMLLKAPCGFLI